MTPRRGGAADRPVIKPKKWLAVMALTPLKVGWLKEGLRGALMAGE
jgi:hypothetical protein